jgi:hypothetical protein
MAHRNEVPLLAATQATVAWFTLFLANGRSFLRDVLGLHNLLVHGVIDALNDGSKAGVVLVVAPFNEFFAFNAHK